MSGPRPAPRLELRCAHRGAARERHLLALAALRARVGRSEVEPPAPAPLVLVHCGGRAAGRVGTGAPLGCEVVHVRIDGPDAVEQAATLVRGALRFAEETGDLRGPRRGPLGLVGPPPLQARAPPWRALHARLEALLAGARARPVALVLSGRTAPPSPDDPLELVQPHLPWIMPMELPPEALGAGIVLRALELGAAAVCSVVPRDDAPSAVAAEAAIAVACAVGEGHRVTRVRSLDEAIERLRAPLLPARPLPEPPARDPAHAPDAHALAISMWRRDGSLAARRLSGPGVPGGAVTVDRTACTLCGLCMLACPTGALTLVRDRTVELRFDSGLCPHPCGRCESACPLGALTVAPELRLPPEHVTLVARAGTCPRCGTLWPGAASVAVLGPKLGAADTVALLRFLSTCPACRSRALASSLGAAAENPC